MAADPARQLPADALLIDGPDLARISRISLGTIHALRRAGKLPLRVIHLARCVRFDRREAEAWIGAGCPGDSRWRAMQQTGVIRRATG
jgi:hypothetical protein